MCIYIVKNVTGKPGFPFLGGCVLAPPLQHVSRWCGRKGKEGVYQQRPQCHHGWLKIHFTSIISVAECPQPEVFESPFWKIKSGNGWNTKSESTTSPFSGAQSEGLHRAPCLCCFSCPLVRQQYTGRTPPEAWGPGQSGHCQPALDPLCSLPPTLAHISVTWGEDFVFPLYRTPVLHTQSTFIFRLQAKKGFSWQVGIPAPPPTTSKGLVPTKAHGWVAGSSEATGIRS